MNGQNLRMTVQKQILKWYYYGANVWYVIGTLLSWSNYQVLAFLSTDYRWRLQICDLEIYLTVDETDIGSIRQGAKVESQ